MSSPDPLAQLDALLNRQQAPTAAGEVLYLHDPTVPDDGWWAAVMTAASTETEPEPTLDPSWRPVDLTEVLAGTSTQPVPELLTRDDGQALLYLAALNGIHGDSGAGKGWVALVTMVQEMQRGHDVVLVDAEDTATSIVARLRLLGATDTMIAEHLVYVRPQTETTHAVIEHLVVLVVERKASLVVVDSIGECFGLDAVDENKDAEVGPWLRRVARPLADTGPGVLLVDHSTKAADNPLHPSGSKRKRAAIGGASYLVEATVPLVAGQGGRLRLTCAKDRHGSYRRGEHVADIVLTATPTGELAFAVYTPSAPAETELPIWLAARAAVRVARDSDEPLSQRALVGLMTVKARAEILRGGVDLAVARGALVETTGPNRARMFSWARNLPEPSP